MVSRLNGDLHSPVFPVYDIGFKRIKQGKIILRTKSRSENDGSLLKYPGKNRIITGLLLFLYLRRFMIRPRGRSAGFIHPDNSLHHAVPVSRNAFKGFLAFFKREAVRDKSLHHGKILAEKVNRLLHAAVLAAHVLHGYLPAPDESNIKRDPADFGDTDDQEDNSGSEDGYRLT